MNALRRQLSELQRWLLAAVVRPESAQPAVVDAAILPSRQQSSAERLAVYQNAYLSRLLNVMRELFPGTRDAVGDELFDEFAAGYLQRYPPSSYTLGRLADHWPAYLDESRPQNAAWGGFIVELAKLEQAIDRIFDGPGPEGQPPFALPVAVGPDLRLALVPGCELHAFQFPVSRYYTAWKAGTQSDWPDEEPQFVALLRRDYIVRRFELSAAQHVLLGAFQGGSTLGEALLAAAAVNEDLSESDIQRWFERWAREGFFAAPEQSPSLRSPSHPAT